MYYSMPTVVYEDERCIFCHREVLAPLGKTALIVTGKHSSKANGALDDLIDSFKELGVEYKLFDAVEENPTTETVVKATEFGRGVDFVVGLGGGSPMDAAKAVALLLANPDKGAEVLYKKQALNAPLPVVAIPTTAGTGSEVTPYSVLTRNDLRTKASIPYTIFPKYALLDPRYITHLPMRILRETAMDALSHLFESYVNANASDLSKAMCLSGLALLKECREVLLGWKIPEKKDYRQLLLASMLAGMAIAHTGTSLPHGLSYTLTYELKIPHGKAVGYFLGGYLKEAGREACTPALNACGFYSAEEISAFYRQLCGAEEMPKEWLEKSVSDLLHNPKKLANAPFKVSEESLRRIAGLVKE